MGTPPKYGDLTLWVECYDKQACRDNFQNSCGSYLF